MTKTMFYLMIIFSVIWLILWFVSFIGILRKIITAGNSLGKVLLFILLTFLTNGIIFPFLSKENKLFAL